MKNHERDIPSFLLKIVSNAIADIVENIDLRKKEVGDRVVVWNRSSFTTLEQKQVRLNKVPDYFIVIDINQDISFDLGVFALFLMPQDLIVVDPTTNEKYRVYSNDVKLFEVKD